MPAASLLAPDLDTEVTAHRRHAPLPDSAKIRPATGPIEFEIIKDRSGLDNLETDWNALFARAGRSHQLFLTFNWLWHWCNHYLQEVGARRAAQLSVVTARRDGRLVMVWPLVSERTHGLTALSWMGDPVSQYGDVLIDDVSDAPAILRQSWEYVRKNIPADVVRLRKVRADAAVAPLLAELGGQVTERLEAPYLDLASAKDFAAYEQRYSGGARRNRRRLFRRLDELGTITFEALTSGAEVRELITLAIELKRKWLATRGLVSKAIADDKFTRFFSDVAAAEERPAGCRVAVLKTAGRPVAIEVAICCLDRVALHIIVFDLEFEKSGAGTLLLEQSIRNASDSGAACYDLLAPGDAYKMDWADATIVVQDWALPLSTMGWFHARVYLGFMRTRLKRAVTGLPPNLRRNLADTLSRLLAKN
jgi:CelD/BcsL family acetyltransferase involved in cellulose biosynthesis